MRSYTLGLFANAYPSDDNDWRGIFTKRMVEDLQSRGINVIRAVKDRSSFWGYIPFYLNSLRLVLNRNIDIFQAEYIPHSSIIPALLKRKKPLILKFHGDDARIFPFKSKFHENITKFMLKRADYVVTSSQEIKEILIRLGANKERISAIHTGVDTQFFHPMEKIECREKLGLNPGVIIFLFVGRLHKWKGIFEIIDVAKKYRDYYFIFVGPGKIPEHTENCQFIGPVAPSTIREWLNSADCILLPTYTEAVPTTLLESSACGIPAIATNIGGCPEVIDNDITGILIPVKDVRALSEAVKWIANNPEKRAVMGLKAREKVIREYERKNLVRNLMDIHMELLRETNLNN